MTFSTLLDDTFLLATGITRDAARQSDRYIQLQSAEVYVPYVSNDAAAEMMLLGEMIADRAFATLPESLQALAKTWEYAGHDGQVDILRVLKRVLGDESLEHREAMKHTRTNINESLPHQYGKQAQRNVLPCCLGMAQILVGFARATGAPHMIIDAVRPYGSYSDEYRYMRLRELHDIIEPYKEDRSINKVLNVVAKDGDDMLKFLAKEAENIESHVLLSIRTDNEWWIIDPYLDVCCKDDFVQKKIDRFYKARVMKRPASTMTMECYNRTKENNVTYHLRALQQYIPYLDKLDQPRADWSFRKEGCELVYYSSAGYNRPGEKAQALYEVCIMDALLHAMYPLYVYNRLLDDKSSELIFNDEFMDNLETRVVALDRTKRIRNQAFKRLVRAVIKNTYNRIYDVVVGSDSPPTIREYLHPTMQLAVKTVNQLAVDRQMDIPQLIKFGSSQWLVYNMLGAVERCGDRRLKQILAKDLRRHSSNTWSALPQLRPYLPELTGENHGKAS